MIIELVEMFKLLIDNLTKANIIISKHPAFIRT